MAPSGLAPPPSYSSQTRHDSATKHDPTLDGLPDHLLLHILSYLSLVSLHSSVRPSSRRLCLFASHLMRRSLLPVYTSKVRSGYSTDATGLRRHTERASATSRAILITNTSREMKVLDLFIAGCVNEAILADASELYLLPSTSASAERDLFDHLQPRARVEDLLVAYGIEDEYVRPTWHQEIGSEAQVVADELSVQLSAKSAKMLLPFLAGSAKSTTVHKPVAEVQRAEGERLEKTAANLLLALSRVPLAREGLEKGWYIKES